MNERQRVPLNY
uniref:Uncharacterized protein n=1 Tax=Anguilla anguilla TaxID=7936 RepID=A0A0E9QWS9_ANGAN